MQAFASRVRIDAGARVLAGQYAAIASSQYVTVIVDGSVAGGSLPGLLLTNGMPYYGTYDPYAGASVGQFGSGTIYPSGGGAVSIGAAGSISGSAAIRLEQRSDNSVAQPFIDVDNQGQLVGTVGPALVAAGGTAFNIVDNAVGATIGGISGAIHYLRNAGTIDGGSGSAIAATAPTFLDGTLYSGGTIRSASTTPTMDLASRSVINEGTIANSGSGAAIAASGALAVTNRAGASITAAGGTAIRSADAIQLTNAGTISGSVISTAGAGAASNIDTLLGTIGGDVLLGAGDDTLAAGLDFTTGRVTAVSGRVDGGAGNDTIAAQIGADTTIRAIVLPANFERFRIDLANNATVALAPGASAPSGIVLGGDGSFTVEGDLVTTGPAFTAGPISYPGALQFENRGAITANLSDPTQRSIDLNAFRLTNSGTIAANGGDGVRATYVFGSTTFANSGTIRASGTAAIVDRGTLINSGLISSSGGVGAQVSGAYGERSTNSGTISGATIGVMVETATLANSGTISGGDIGAILGFTGQIENLAGGTISGSTAAISRASYGAGNRVSNAGTINGDVDFANGTPYDSSSDTFVNDGGTVNGNVRLGGGDDIYVTDLGGPSGVTGSIDGGDGRDTVAYRVRADTTAIVAPLATFEGLDYQLIGDVALTLTAPAAQTLAVSLAGVGRVDLSADLAQSDHAVLDLTGNAIYVPQAVYAPTDLDVISRGTLSLSTSQQYGYTLIAAVNAGTAKFENAGTINTSATPGGYYLPRAIFGGSEVINSGTISLDGATGVEGATRLVNSGSIVQAAGGASSQGVANVAELVNSGTISVDGPAVFSPFGSDKVTNSGTIESRGTTAIQLYGSGSIVNQAGGVIRGNGYAISADGGTSVRNDGTIVGDVRLGSDYSYGGNSFVSNGTLTGNLQFGAGNDLFLQLGDTTGVSGTIDGGAGTDTFGRSFGASATTAVGGALPANFEREIVDAHGAGTVVTVTGPTGGLPRDLYFTGDGSIVNRADVTGTVHLTSLAAFGGMGGPVGTFTNAATIGSVEGSAGSFATSGTIGSVTLSGTATRLFSDNDIAFANSGTILNADSGAPAVALQSANGGLIAIANSGAITGGLRADVANSSLAYGATPTDTALAIDNSGTITSSAAFGGALQVVGYTFNGNASAITLTNSGRISATGTAGVGAFLGIPSYGDAPPSAISVVNSGAIEATGAGQSTRVEISPGRFADYVYSSVGLLLDGAAATTIAIRNDASGRIAAPAAHATALVVSGSALSLDNAGTVAGGPGEQIAVDNGNTTYYLPGAIQSYDTDDHVANRGTITGSIDLGAGNDRIENLGTIDGDVFLRDGDDSFLQRASATVTGTVDGGAGIDALTVDATGGGAIDGDRFVNFESFTQTGTGNVAYSGAFHYDTIALAGGTITVAPGETLRTDGPVTITGSDAAEAVINNGTISGAVLLGGGDDSYTEGPGSSAGAIDGGAGTDTYVVALAGHRQGVGARTGFERLAVTGTGSLGLTLDQPFDNVALAGTGLDLHLAGFAVGGIDGSDAAESLSVDGDVARVSLGGGDDALSIAATTLAGSYDGGAGNDRLALTPAGPVTLAGTVTGFEIVALSGGALAVSGTLGSADAALSFGGGPQALTIEKGGRILGTVDLGDGDDSFHLAAGGLLQGSISGGAGSDRATVDLAADLTIAGETLRDFETLTTTGGKTLTFGSGSGSFGRIDADGGLTVAAGGALVAAQVQFGGGNDRFVIAGTFTGSVDGGGGANTIVISGGSTAAPVAFSGVDRFDSLAQSAGFATIAGAARLGRIDLTGGRLVGLAGSTITAPEINVGAGATFGSAGSVVGNIAVAGTLSPGASPGTMTVTGNVSLAAGSTSLFELTPTVSDKLVLSGTLSIAGGATMTLVGKRPLTPGAALDLIVAGGGISGSFSAINQPATILGFVRQSSSRIQLFGQFDATGFNRQVTATVNYVNGVLTSGQARPALIAAVPMLLTSGNATNGAAFARLNPEAYASATQISIENGLTLAKVSRAGAAAIGRDEAGVFTFAQGLGNWRPLDGSTAQGTSQARTNSYGVLGGIAFGTVNASLGGFIGYLDSRQRIAGLGARTQSDGIVAGLLGHASAAGFDLSALLAYDGGKADTRRALPGQLSAASRYHLRGLVSDTSISYAVPLTSGWSLKPGAGLTYIETRRGGATESGGGAFSLDVARRKSHATFVDGALTLQGGNAPAATFHPWISAGVRYQLNGRATLASASFAVTDGGFSVLGVGRQATLATAGAGAALTLRPGLELFAGYRGEFGSDGTGSNVNGGLKLRF